MEKEREPGRFPSFLLSGAYPAGQKYLAIFLRVLYHSNELGKRFYIGACGYMGGRPGNENFNKGALCSAPYVRPGIKCG